MVMNSQLLKKLSWEKEDLIKLTQYKIKIWITLLKKKNRINYPSHHREWPMSVAELFSQFVSSPYKDADYS